MASHQLWVFDESSTRIIHYVCLFCHKFCHGCYTLIFWSHYRNHSWTKYVSLRCEARQGLGAHGSPAVCSPSNIRMMRFYSRFVDISLDFHNSALIFNTSEGLSMNMLVWVCRGERNRDRKRGTSVGRRLADNTSLSQSSSHAALRRELQTRCTFMSCHRALDTR